MIIVRADGNKEIGTGHLMRCISIMEQSKERSDIMFLVADQSAKEIIEKKGFLCTVLNTDYKNMESEIPLIEEMIQKLEVELILVDSYQITALYLEKLSKYTSVVIVEDVMHEAYAVSGVINYNIYARQEQYRELYNKTGYKTVEFYMGIRFAPLREEFSSTHFNVHKEIKDIFISTGGSDPYNYSGGLLNNLLHNVKFKNYKYHVICGVFNKNRDFLYEMKEKYNNVIVYENVSNISEIMQQCDVAISAAGSTMYELASVGIPIITFAFVDNQDEIARSFSEQKLALFAGDSFDKMDVKVERISKKLEYFDLNYDLRLEMSNLLQKAVDGKGAKRLYQMITTGKEDL